MTIMFISLVASTTISSPFTSGNPLGKSRTTHPAIHLCTRVPAYTSCERNKQNKEDTTHVIDRRNMLIGIGGLYGSATAAIGAPLQPPDLSKCNLATDEATGEKVQCCPPYSTAKIKNFEPPNDSEPLRIRRPAHKLTLHEIERFEEAIAAMKALPPDDPWNYMQQATIHCTYCNGAFDQKGYDVPLQVHASWFFLPWHRYYLYFWEKILGKLIDDPTFAIPYWNWDTPKGMYMPEMYYSNHQSPLYDATRDQSHLKSVLDFNYAYPTGPTPCINRLDPKEPDDEVIITRNMCQLDKIFRESTNFMGPKRKAGEVVPEEYGSLESIHNTIHQWVGPPCYPYQNMGNFHTAARDTMFFGLHANVDRMWDIHSYLDGPEFSDSDWLDSSFIFYDENRQVVKVKVSDCLKPEDLGYSYKREELPWYNIRRKCKKESKAAKKRSAGESMKLIPVSEFGSKPRALLTEPIKALVTRPKVSRSKDEKEEAIEVLVIEGIVTPPSDPARFDVYVTKPIEGLVNDSDKGELAGSFVKLPHGGGHKSSAGVAPSSKLVLGISSLLEDIEGAEGSDKLVVILVPRNGDVTIGGISVKLLEVD